MGLGLYQLLANCLMMHDHGVILCCEGSQIKPYWPKCQHVVSYLPLVSTILYPFQGAGIAIGSVLGLLPCLMQCRRLNPPLRRFFPVEGIFHLELTWVLTLFPKKTLLDESIN